MSSLLRSSAEVRGFLSAEGQYKHGVVELEDGQSITVLINGNDGWLMYLRESGDSGFSTRNPDRNLSGDTLEFYLSNGQRDEYPSHWSYPVDQIAIALDEFLRTKRIPSQVCWHDDCLPTE